MEEDPVYGKDLVEVLEHDGWRVDWAKSAKEGISASLDGLALVIVDASTEDFFTLELVHTLSQQRHVPLVTICSRSDMEFTDRFLQDGAVDVIIREDVPVTAFPLMLIRSLFLHTQDDEQKRLTDRLQGRYWLKDEGEARDASSELYTQAYMVELLQLEIAHARADRIPVAVLLLSVDQLAHLPAGDSGPKNTELYRQVGRFLRTQLRTMDLLGRYGAEEFLAILPGADVEGAEGAAHRLVEKCGKETIADDQPQAVTLSCGVAVYDPHTAPTGEGGKTDWSTLIERAEKSLHSAKKSGGSQAGTAAAIEAEPR